MTDARTLTAALGGKWHRTYGLACCPAHGDRRPSLTLADAPDGRLLLHCKAGCAFADVLTALRNRGMVDGRDRPPPPDPAEIARRRAEDEAAAAKKEKQALACWREAVPIAGTAAERYLREARGITCDLPASLRFHADCWHGATARRLPAMIALVEGMDRAAIHRTFIQPDGAGKAAVEPNKMMLGSCAGGHVELATADGPLVVCEGIETGLALASGLLRRPATIWAALSAPGMAAVRLPDRPGRLTIATDSDDAGAGERAGRELATRAKAAGWQVFLLPAPQGRDWADVKHGGRAA